MRFIDSRLVNPRLLCVLLLGFSSGLPLILTAGTLQAWYTDSGLSIVAIGSLSLIGQPYVYKFLWAPLMDRYTFGLGRRRGWILSMQLALVVGLMAMAFSNPVRHPLVLAWIAVLVATFSASQDIAIDAYRTDVLKPVEYGAGAALNTLGYRLAMFISGALALILASAYSWRFMYVLMAVFMLVAGVVTLFSPEPKKPPATPTTLHEAVVLPWREFLKRPLAIAILVFIVIYKLSDAFALTLTTPFLLRGMRFSLVTIGSVAKVVSLVGSLAGVSIGGLCMSRVGLYRSLWYFGILQILSNLLFCLLVIVGKNVVLMATVMLAEHFCGSLSTVAFIAFLMSLCDERYTAAQFALFTALSAVGRVFVGPEAGLMVEHLGWLVFYFSTFLIGIPSLVLLWWLGTKLNFKQLGAHYQ